MSRLPMTERYRWLTWRSSRPQVRAAWAATAVVAMLLGRAATAQTVALDAASYTVSEGAGVVQFCLLRSGDLSGTTFTGVRTVQGTATDNLLDGGLDYFALGGAGGLPPLNFFAGSSQICHSVTIIDDTIVEADETFVIEVEVFAGGSLGSPSFATVTILDNDNLPPGPPRLSFDVAGLDTNLQGTYVVPGESDGRRTFPRCLGVVPVVLDRVSDSPVEVSLRGDSAPSGDPVDVTVSIPAGELGTSVVLGEGSFGRGSERGTSWNVSMAAPRGAVVETPSGIRVVCHRRVVECRARGPSFEDQPICSRCPVCENRVWLWDAGFLPSCPLECEDTELEPEVFSCPSTGVSADGPTSSDLLRQDLERQASPQGTLPPVVATLRDFRDDVLGRSDAGRYYTESFYGFGDVLSDALFSSPGLVFDVLEAQGPWLDGIVAANEGRGSEVTITQDMVADLGSILDRVAESGGRAVAELIERDETGLDLASLPGLDFDQFLERVELDGGGFDCEPADDTLCLNGGRFWVQVEWTDFEDNVGFGRAVPLTDDTGAFWFFDEENVELMIKVLDGTGLNGNFWVYYGALSNVEYTITVLDTITGRVATYTNPAGSFGSVGDTNAIATTSQRRWGRSRNSISPSMLLRGLASETWKRLGQSWDRVWSGRPSGVDLLTPRALQPVTTSPGTSGNCVASGTRLCLNNNRFAVEVTWRDFEGRTGVGQAVALTPDTGTFWFFDDANVELVIKVLDGTALNGRFWVFYGALSNVEYTITVTDTQTGAIRTYTNPLGEFGSLGDTEAF